MPELPEVETIRLGLEKFIIGQQIKAVKVDWAGSMPAVKADIEAKVIKSKVDGIDRKGKVLIIHLDSGSSLLIHLKMTGQLVYDQAKRSTLNAQRSNRFTGGHPTSSMAGKLPDSSTRVIFELKSRTSKAGKSATSRLFFNDQRKFGWIKLIPSKLITQDSLLARLGPEPLSTKFTLSGLATEVKSHARAPIKAVIMDQSTVAGVGNIYADEALHLAKIHPRRLAGSLGPGEIKRLHAAIKDVLRRAIKYGGTSVTNYVNILGNKGDYLEHARVFRKAGTPCPVCGTPIEKIRVAGRGTHFCPRCQKLSV